MITQELVKELFDYHYGELYWRVSLSRSVKIGDAAGSVNSTGYKQTRINGKIYQNHRLIFLWHHGYLPKKVDHKDNISLNNAIDNLRIATSIENGQNAKKRVDNTSGVKGVYKVKSEKKWRVQLSVGKTRKSFGSYHDIQIAKFIAETMRYKYHGAYANHG